MDDDEKTALARAVAAYLLLELRWRDVANTAEKLGLSPSPSDVEWVEKALVAAATELFEGPTEQ